MGKHEIFSNISNKFYTYHLLILQGLFTTLSWLDLFFLSGEDSWALSLLCAAFSHARILLYGFIKSDSDLFKEKIQPTFCGGFSNHLFSKLALFSKKEDLGLGGSAAVWHLILRAYYY